MWYVYFLELSNGNIYVGTDLRMKIEKLRKMGWLNTETDGDTSLLAEEKWTPAVSETSVGSITVSIQGLPLESEEFWADAIKKLRDNPSERLRMAERNLPLPAAWREAVIALWSLVRRERKPISATNSNLQKLQFYAAIWSMYVPYSTELRMPGYNVFERIPFLRFRQLDLSWNTIGCDELELLSKTDRKLMRETWGEPANHTTAAEIYQYLWSEYEQKLMVFQ